MLLRCTLHTLVIFCDGLNACQCLSEAGVFVSSLVTHWTGNSPGRKVSHTLNYFHPAKLTKIKGENIIYQQKISGQIQQRTKTDIHIPDAHGGALSASLREILKSNINSCAQQDGMRLIKWDIAEKLNCPQLHSALTNFNRSLDSSTCNQIRPAHHSSYNLKMMMAIAIKITIKTKGAK